LHLAVAPVGSVLPLLAVLAEPELDPAALLLVLALLLDPLPPVLAGLVDPPPLALAGAGALPPSFFTPPWCEQAPLPALDVLPSEQVTSPELPDALPDDVVAGAAVPPEAVDPPSFFTPPW